MAKVPVKKILIILALSIVGFISVGVYMLNDYIHLKDLRTIMNPSKDLQQTPEQYTPTESPFEKALRNSNNNPTPTQVDNSTPKPNVTQDTKPNTEPTNSSTEKTDEPTNNEPNNSASNQIELIIADYQVRFIELQQRHQALLSSLIAEAKVEYSKSGSKTNTLTLATKYIKKANTMESLSDAEFKSLLKEFDNKLKEHSADTTIIKEIDTYYIAYKKDLRTKLLMEAAQHM